LETDITAHVTTGAVIVYLLEWLKRSGWCPLTTETKHLNRLLSGLLAVVAALGIQWSYDPATGGVIHLPALAMLVTSGWEVIKQFTVQQLIWDGIVEPKRP